MMLSILAYSIFTGLCYFAQQPWHLGALRFLAAFGMGGATQLLDAPDQHLLAYLRTHPRGDAVLVVANVGDQAK